MANARWASAAVLCLRLSGIEILAIEGEVKT